MSGVVRLRLRLKPSAWSKVGATLLMRQFVHHFIVLSVFLCLCQCLQAFGSQCHLRYACDSTFRSLCQST